MNYVIWLAAGALVGWIASLVLGTERKQPVWLDVAIGIVAVLIAGLVVSPVTGLPPLWASALSLGTLLVSVVVAVLALIVVNVIRRGDRGPR